MKKIDVIVMLVNIRDRVIEDIDKLTTVCGKEPKSIHIYKHKDFLDLLEQAQVPVNIEDEKFYKFIYCGVEFRNIYDEME